MSKGADLSQSVYAHLLRLRVKQPTLCFLIQKKNRPWRAQTMILIFDDDQQPTNIYIISPGGIEIPAVYLGVSNMTCVAPLHGHRDNDDNPFIRINIVMMKYILCHWSQERVKQSVLVTCNHYNQAINKFIWKS